MKTPVSRTSLMLVLLFTVLIALENFALVRDANPNDLISGADVDSKTHIQLLAQAGLLHTPAVVPFAATPGGIHLYLLASEYYDANEGFGVPLSIMFHLPFYLWQNNLFGYLLCGIAFNLILFLAWSAWVIRRFSPRTYLFAAVFYLFSPLNFKPWVLVVMGAHEFSLLFLWLLLNLIPAGRPRRPAMTWLAVGIVAGFNLCIHVKNLLDVLLVIALAVFLALRRELRWRTLPAIALGIAIGYLPLAATFAAHGKSPLLGFTTQRVSAPEVTDYFNGYRSLAANNRNLGRELALGYVFHYYQERTSWFYLILLAAALLTFSGRAFRAATARPFAPDSLRFLVPAFYLAILAAIYLPNAIRVELGFGARYRYDAYRYVIAAYPFLFVILGWFTAQASIFIPRRLRCGRGRAGRFAVPVILAALILAEPIAGEFRFRTQSPVSRPATSFRAFQTQGLGALYAFLYPGAQVHDGLARLRALGLPADEQATACRSFFYYHLADQPQRADAARALFAYYRAAPAVAGPLREAAGVFYSDPTFRAAVDHDFTPAERADAYRGWGIEQRFLLAEHPPGVLLDFVSTRVPADCRIDFLEGIGSGLVITVQNFSYDLDHSRQLIARYTDPEIRAALRRGFDRTIPQLRSRTPVFLSATDTSAPSAIQ